MRVRHTNLSHASLSQVVPHDNIGTATHLGHGEPLVPKYQYQAGPLAPQVSSNKEDFGLQGKEGNA